MRFVMAHVASSLLVLISVGLAAAQDDPPLKPEELDALTAPIALYPDSLLSQVLMATTYPADVATAAEWSEANNDVDGDAAVKAVEGEEWDPSVKSLCAFPSMLAMMKADPDWVQKIGDAFLAQSKDVLDSVQRLRRRAKDEGNLETSDQYIIKEELLTETTEVQPSTPAETTTIVIEPADPEVIYVPNYDTAIVYGSWGYAYPPYYFPPPRGYIFGGGLRAGLGFAAGVAIGDALWGDCDWGGGDIDIDVDHYNNINVGNEIGSGNSRWEHNGANRDGVPYRDSTSREKYAKNTSGAEQRTDYRGRDVQREAARGDLERSTGVSTRDAPGAVNEINRDLGNQGINANDLGRGGGGGAPGFDPRVTGGAAGGFDPRVTGGGGANGFDPRLSGGGGAGQRDGGGGNLGGGGAGQRDVGASRRSASSRGAGYGNSGGYSNNSAFTGAGSGASRESMQRGSYSAGGRSMSMGGSRGGGARGGGGGRRR